MLTKNGSIEISLDEFLSGRDKKSVWYDTYPVIVDETDTNKIITIYISDVIAAPYEFNKAFHTILKARPEDLIIVHINTPGGAIDSANMLCHALENTAAKVHGVLTGSVCSAGTLITMYCDTIEVATGCAFMIHNYSAGLAGKGHEIKAQQKFMDTELNEYFANVYGGFLTPEEIASVIEGKDLWLSKAEVEERWANKTLS